MHSENYDPKTLEDLAARIEAALEAAEELGVDWSDPFYGDLHEQLSSDLGYIRRLSGDKTKREFRTEGVELTLAQLNESLDREGRKRGGRSR